MVGLGCLRFLALEANPVAGLAAGSAQKGRQVRLQGPQEVRVEALHLLVRQHGHAAGGVVNVHHGQWVSMAYRQLVEIEKNKHPLVRGPACILMGLTPHAES